MKYVLNRLWTCLSFILYISYFILSSCTSPIERRPIVCPKPPEPVCKPGTFDKVLLDTTFHDLAHPQLHITNLGAPINTTAGDDAITFVPSAGGLTAIITTNRLQATAHGAGAQQLYAAKFIRTTQFSTPKQVGITNHSVPFGSGYYSAADGMFYFSAKAANADADDFDLFTARITMEGDSVSLSDIHAIAALNTVGHFESQPTLDAPGTHIYFVSDRPGGSGGTDIWTAHRSSVSSQNWSDPEPLPPPINTECDELSPYISPNDPGTFYFASNGHETVGGFDLFKASAKDGGFSNVQNLGKPINTPYDEIFPVALNDTAFFWSSNKPGGLGGMDLYTITRSYLAPLVAHGHVAEPERPVTEHLHKDTEATPLGPVAIDVHVTRGNDFRPAVGSDVFVKKDSIEIYRGGVPANGEIIFKVKRDSVYDVGAETEDAFFDVKHVDLRGFKDSVMRVDLHLPDTLVLRINFPFDDYEHPYEFVIDENGSASSMTWREALNLAARSALQSTNRLKELVLIGHTDSLGTDAYNERLGFRRATFVAQQLEARGVPHRIIRIVSKGRTQPMGNRPSESDDLFRLRSRRVEFIKVFK